MDDRPIRPGRGRGGAPPKINEQDLLGKYGQAAVDLVKRLYHLASEGEFSATDAAQLWADTDPQAARGHRVLSQSGADVVIDRRRLSEAMKMDKGPIPAGLVRAFLDLWARGGYSRERVRRTADELTRLCHAVGTAAEHNATVNRSAHRSKAVARADEVAHLKDQLLRVQEDLIRTQKNEVRFRDLSSFMLITLTRLHSNHQKLVKERDELLARAEAAEAIAAAVNDAETAYEQLARAQRQLEQVRAKAGEAEQLVRQLQDRHVVLVTRLLEVDDAVDVAPPVPGVSRIESEGLPAERSLAQHEAVLDRVDDMLTEGDHELVETRHRLEDDTLAAVDLGDAVEGEVVLPRTTPDNPATSQNGFASPDNGSDGVADGAAERLGMWSLGQRPSWMERLKAFTGGLIGPAEKLSPARRRELIDLITRPTVLPHHIAVLSLKGGVGKTTVTACLGATLASLRPDRVIAIDVDPDRGTLALRGYLETTATIRHVLRDVDTITDYQQVRAYTSRGTSGLEVLASDKDPFTSEALSADDYLRVVSVLERFYNIVLTDCGTGMTHSAMAGVLSKASSLVLVASASVDGAQSSAATLDWLQANGHEDLVARSVAVINSPRVGSGRIDMDKLVGHFSQRCRAVVILPWDDHLADGAEVDLRAASPDTRNALLSLAATITDDFFRYALPPSPLEWRSHEWRSPVPELITGTPEPPVPDPLATAPEPIATPLWPPSEDSLEAIYADIRKDLVNGDLTVDEYLLRRDEAKTFIATSAPLMSREQALAKARTALGTGALSPAAFETRKSWILSHPGMFPRDA